MLKQQAIVFVALCIGLTLPACARPQETPPAKPGRPLVYLDNKAINELSGITRIGGDRYLVVSDNRGRAAEATIRIDPDTGEITHASLGRAFRMEGGQDTEDIAYDPADGTILVVDESGQTITRHKPDGSKTGSIHVPREFTSARPNLGLESLAISPDGKHVWTVNEEALKGDGERADAENGTLLRLQRFDASGRPGEQYGYVTDPHRGADNVFKRAQCGVSGLVALESGALIVMERELGGRPIPTFRIRLYRVEPPAAGAGDSGLVVVDKQLIHEVDAGLANYEGITLGPTLANGDATLLLIADDGGGRTNPQSLLAVRIKADAFDGKARP